MAKPTPPWQTSRSDSPNPRGLRSDTTQRSTGTSLARFVSTSVVPPRIKKGLRTTRTGYSVDQAATHDAKRPARVDRQRRRISPVPVQSLQLNTLFLGTTAPIRGAHSQPFTVTFAYLATRLVERDCRQAVSTFASSGLSQRLLGMSANARSLWAVAGAHSLSPSFEWPS